MKKKRNTKSQKCYKVVYHHRTRGFYSVICRECEYFKGKTTVTPPNCAKCGYYLTAFDTLKAANDFRLAYSPRPCWEVWEATGYNRQIVPPAAFPNSSVANMIVHGASPSLSVWCSWPWPKGTLMYEKIKLERKVT